MPEPSLFLGGKSQAVVELCKPTCVPSRPLSLLLMPPAQGRSHCESLQRRVGLSLQRLSGKAPARPAACSQRNETGCHHGHPAPPPPVSKMLQLLAVITPGGAGHNPSRSCLQGPLRSEAKSPFGTRLVPQFTCTNASSPRQNTLRILYSQCPALLFLLASACSVSPGMSVAWVAGHDYNGLVVRPLVPPAGFAD